MGNITYYTVARAWIAPYPHHWAHPEVEGGCCFSLYLAGIAWSEPASGQRAWARRSRSRDWELYYNEQPRRSWQLSQVSPTQLCKKFACSPGIFLPYIFSTTTVRTPRRALGKFGCVIFQWLLCHWNWQAPYPAWQEQPQGLLEASLQYGPDKAPHFPFSSSNSSESTTNPHLPPAMMIWLISAKWGFEYINKKTYETSINELSWCLPMFLAMSV